MAKTNVFNPFPGLRPFNAEEDYLFFGREHQTNELLQLLRTHRFIAVVGTSGSGKSSLVRAGVLPALFGGTMVGVGSQWETVVFRPGGDPLINLAQGMIDSDLYDPEDAEAPLRIRATLSRSRLGLAQAVEQSDLTDQTNLLIVVDQFEELFRFRDTTPEHQGLATAFVKLLLNAAADENQPIYVAITMRSDYLGDCAQIPGLAEAVNHGEYLIPKLTRDQRRDAIEKPTAVGGGKMSPALVQQLLNDVGDDADQLPILQHALMRIWNKWESGHEADEPIGLRHYDSVGGLQSALSLHADEVYTELRDEDMRALAERVFKAITEKGEDKRGIRRPTRLDHLCQIVDGAPEDVNLVLDAYRKAGRTFVMPTGKTELVPETVVDISHESLMRVWERLKGWVGEESQSARIYRRLADTAALHADGRAGVYRDPDLQIASSWRERSRPTEAWADRYHAGLETALAFLDKSWDTAHAEEEERERARQRELKQAQRLAEAERQRAEVQAKAKRRLYVLLGGISVALLVAIGMYLYAEQQRTLAESNRLEAMENERRATANAAEARRQEVVARENASEAQRQEGIARENAAEAENQAERARQAREEARRRLYISNMLTAHRAFELGEGISRAAQLLGDWRPKAVERDIRGWEWYYLSAQQRSAGEVLSTGTRWRGAAVWSPVEEVLAYAANDYSVVVYDRAKRQEIKRLVGHGDDVMSLAFSHDGRLLVSGSRDQTVRLWDVEVGVEMQVMKGHRGGVHSVAWSPDQKRVVSAAGGPSFGSGHTARIWDVKTGTMSRMVSGEWPGWMSSRWSPDGKYLATAYHAHRVVIRNGESYEEVRTLTTRSPTVVCLEWATDSKRLATGDESGIIQIWNVEDGQEVGALTGHTGQIRSLVWSPDDSELLTGGHDGSVRVWTVEQSALKKVVSNAGFQVMDLAWSRDGREFLVNGANGTLWIHAAEETQASRNRSQHSGIGSSVQWNPVDKRIAFGGDDRQVYVLDPTSTTDATLLSGHQGKVNAVCWSGDGRWLASASNDRTVRIWSGESLELVKELTGFIGEVRAIDWSPDGSKLAVGVAQNDANAFSNSGGNVERGVVVFDVSDPRNASLMYEFAAHQATFAVAWHPDSGQLATAGMNRRNDGDRIRVWDVVSGRQVNQVSLPFENVYALDWSSDGMRLAAGTNDGVNNGHVKVVDMTDSSVLLDLLGQVSVFSVSFNASASRLVAAGKDQTVKIWDIESGAELLSLSASSSSVFSAAWSPDETKIAAIGAELILYDAYDGFLQELSPSLLDALGEEIEDGTGGVAARESRAEIFSLLNQWDDAESDLKAVGESPDSQQSWFIMPWRIRGPFDEHSNQNTAIDRVPDPFARGPGVLSAGGDEWKPIPLEDDGLVNMARFTGGREDCSCYALSRVYSTQDQEVVVMLGTDDRHRLWINGELAHETFGNRPAVPDQDVVTTKLKAGWNTVLVKVFQSFGGHGMYFRLTDDDLQVARAFARNGRHAEAVEKWSELIERYPQRRSYLVARLDSAMKGGLNDVAMRDLNTIKALAPNNTSLLLKRADLLHASGDLDAAIGELSVAIERSSGEADFLIRRAELNHLIGEGQRADEDFARALVASAGDGDPTTRVSSSARSIGRIVSALDQIAIVTSGVNAITPWRYSFEAPASDWKAVEYDDQKWKWGNSPFGSNQFSAKTIWNTQNPEIWLRREFVLDVVPEGKLSLDAMIDDYAEVYLNGVWLATGKWAGMGRQRLRSRIGDSTLLRKGKNVLAVHGKNLFPGGAVVDVALAVKNTNRQAVVDVLDRARELSPDDKVLEILRGSQLAMRQRWSEASESYRVGIGDSAADHWSWYESSTVEWQLGNMEEYQRQIRAMVDEHKSSNNATHVRRMMIRALFPDQTGIDPKELEGMGEFIRRRANQHPFTTLTLGVLEFRKGNLDEAERLFLKARAIRRTWWAFHGQYRGFRARIAYRQGNIGKALGIMRQANRILEGLGPQSVEEHLGRGFVDVMPSLLMASEAADEIVSVLDSEPISTDSRRLGIEALRAIARRQRYRGDATGFRTSVRRMFQQYRALIEATNEDDDRQRAMLFVWSVQHCDMTVRPAPGEICEIAKWLCPPELLALPADKWTVLKPGVAVSDSDATMEVLEDDSILLKGRRTQKDVYRINYDVAPMPFSAVRLELLSHDDLYSYGPGRAFNGNVHIHEVEMKLGVGDVARDLVKQVAGVTTAYNGMDLVESHQVAQIFDGDLKTFWDVWPKTGRDHSAVIELEEEVRPVEGEPLQIVIKSVSEKSGQLTPGRFRVSVNASVGARKMYRCWPSAAVESVSYWSIVANALLESGQSDAARSWVEKALDATEAPTAFDWLVAARFYRETGDAQRAGTLHQRAVDWAVRYPPGEPVFENLVDSLDDDNVAPATGD